MSEDRTAETGGSRSFEERVFLRFDALDAQLEGVDSRFGGFEKRLETLEAKQYDTKPIWERALSEIAETRSEMRTGFEQTRTEVQETRGEVHNDLEKIRIELDDGLRKAADQIDALNGSILEMRGDIRYFSRRIQKLESEMLKPS